MEWMRAWPILVLLLSGCVTRSASAEAPPATRPAPQPNDESLRAFNYAAAAGAKPAFDPARHMRVAEVKIGMKGYGLTVFKGTQIEKFDVEVLSILKNFNPQYDVVLIRCKNEFLEHTGSIAGMSGSPIYLHDEAGHDRMIGAFAYGWPLAKDPVAGVQPIEYMLSLPTARHDNPSEGLTASTQPATNPAQSDAPLRAEGTKLDESASPAGRLTWSMLDAGLLPPRRHSNLAATAFPTGPAPQPMTSSLAGNGDDMPTLQPLATPMMTSGISPALLKQLAPMFQAAHLTALQAGGSGSAAAGDEPAAVLEPGAALAVPLLTGDVDMTAVGTVTEVLGNRMWGFGHPFNNEGAVALPMGSGYINGVIANLQTSFKLGSMTLNRGTLTTDQSVGVAGQIGALAPTIPIEFKLYYPHQAKPRIFRFQSALHPKLTPMLAGAAFGAALTGPSELPTYNTLDYELNLQFNDGQVLKIANRAANTTPADLFNEIGIPLQAAAENPFRSVLLSKLTGEIHITDDAKLAQLVNVTVPKALYRPGEVVKAFITYKPFRAAEATFSAEMELPRNLPKGQYQLVISDAERYFADEQQATPFRFTAEKVEDIFAILRDVTSIRENALYVRLLRQPDGVAIGRTALQRLPSSRRQILLGAGRNTTTAFVSSTVKIIPTELVMQGSAEFTLTIDTSPKVAAGTIHKNDAGGPTKTDDTHAPHAVESGPTRPKDSPGESPKETP